MKTLTMQQLRNTLGTISYEIRERRQSYVLTFQGKPFAKLVPLDGDDVTIIESDGSVKGERPLTAGCGELLR